MECIPTGVPLRGGIDEQGNHQEDCRQIAWRHDKPEAEGAVQPTVHQGPGVLSGTGRIAPSGVPGRTSPTPGVPSTHPCRREAMGCNGVVLQATGCLDTAAGTTSPQIRTSSPPLGIRSPLETGRRDFVSNAPIGADGAIAAPKEECHG